MERTFVIALFIMVSLAGAALISVEAWFRLLALAAALVAAWR